MSNKIKVDLGNNSYNISLIEDFKASIVKFASSTESQCMLITQEEIFNLYKSSFNELSDIVNVNIFLINQGEEAKSFESISSIVNDMASKHFDRSSLVFAVGGGVVGDVAGFAASIFMRGIKYIQYPTTLLAMVDSAIGGKTGINYKGIINSLGNYYHADRVYISKNIIKLIPEREYISGIPEIIKCGLINDKKIFKLLKNKKKILDRDFKHISKLIQLSLQTKIKFFKKDVEEKNERLKLNFGHTFAHAIEMALDKKKTEIIRHGEAVAIGLLCEIFYAKGDNNDFKKTKEILEMFNIPNNLNSYRKRTAYTELKKKIFQNIFLDKKRIGLNPRYIKLTNIGKSNISEMKNYNRIYKTIDYVIFGKKINA